MASTSKTPHPNEPRDLNSSGWAQALRFAAPDGSRRTATSGRTRRRRARRRGSLYVAVLGVTMIVGMMALAAMHVVRINMKAAAARTDRYEAGVLAASAVENGLMVLANNVNWRTSLQSGTAYPTPSVKLGRGSFTWKVVDSDGNLADDLSDTVLLQGIGRVGGVTHVEEVCLQPTDFGLTCLEASLHCQEKVDLGTNAKITTNQAVSSNKDIDARALSAKVDGNAESGKHVNGTVTGTISEDQPSREMPGSNAFDYYINLGTLIDVNLLPSGSGYRSLEKILLSPQSNPYGNPSPEGIYVLDCQGIKVYVRDLRVVGTLVLLNLGSGSRIEHEVLFEPAVPNYPSLLVRGNIELRIDSWSLLNEGAEGVNFNPPGTPYNGSVDTDKSDVYPNLIKGLVYVSGLLDVPQDFLPSTLDGVVVCGSINANSDLNLTYRSTFLTNPPPGFAAGSTMKIAPGTWTRAASP